MAVTSRRNSGTKKKNVGRTFSRAQIKAGFGGKRRQAAQKAAARHKPRTQSNKPKATRPSHRPRTAPVATRPNLGKIVSYTLPKENKSVATAKKNKGRKAPKKHYTHHAKAKKNTGRKTKRNSPAMSNMSGIVSSAVFTLAGGVGTQMLTQAVLQSSNTGVMGYIGNLITAGVLAYGAKAFLHNERAAGAIFGGGVLVVVIRLISDYTPYGSLVKNLGMGDYLTQFPSTPQHIARSTNWPHSAGLTMNPTMGGNGMNGCDLYGANRQYA